MMKKSVLIAALGLFSLNTMAQDAPKEEGFVFTTVKENPITSIKNQNRSSTCWSFSSLGFLESELLRRTPHHGRPRTELRTLSRRQFFLTGRKFL